jgi:hypothetical protein
MGNGKESVKQLASDREEQRSSGMSGEKKLER